MSRDPRACALALAVTAPGALADAAGFLLQIAGAPRIRHGQQTAHAEVPWAALDAAAALVPTGVQVWTVHRPGRPWSLNEERSRHWALHRQLTRDWREGFAVGARAAKVPALDSVAIVATPHYARNAADTGNCYGAVKAAIDGLTDAGVIPDDTGHHVQAIVMDRPRLGTDGLTLTIVAAPREDA